ncbi:MAG TPA: hypothetical protein VIZ69_09335 [Thermoanaerobaculia bacterium]
MSCPNPIDAGILADYWIGALPGGGPEEESVEEHLFDCDECGDRLRDVIALAEGVRALAREGSLRMVVSEAFLRSAAEDGLRIREYAPPPGGGVQCTVTAEDDLLISRLAADLSGAARVDLCICDENGVVKARMADIPVHSEAGGITFQEDIAMVKAAPTHKMIARLVAVDPAGSERLLGEYTFNHTRSLAGPGSW